jgi:hypothetical protein
LWECTAHNCITGLAIFVGRSQFLAILICIKVTSYELYQPKSVLPWWLADAVLSTEVMCELGSTLEPTVTYMAAVQWLFNSKMTLKHQQHKEHVSVMYTNLMLKLTVRAITKCNGTHTGEVLLTQLFCTD